MNRVIKDAIWNSPSLAKLDMVDQLHWPRWLLMGDDWGCFESDTDIIKGLVYPKMREVDQQEIDRLKDVYFYSGKIFFWKHGDREYGFFVSHISHQFCNSTSVDSTTRRQVRHKRRTPEPNFHLVKRYLNIFKKIGEGKQVDSGKLERLRTFTDKYRIPNPNPIPKPNPIPNHPSGKKDSLKGKKGKAPKVSEPKITEASIKKGKEAIKKIKGLTKGIGGPKK